MANTKSAKKNVLINQRNRERNLAYKTLAKTVVKQANQAIESNPSQAETTLRVALKTLDKLATKGIIKRSTVARKKSRLALRFNNAAVA
ncbi:30S ribosomal protein S20 [bacterium]|nr:30S ribosomal protein S20 [bacterium]